MYAVLMTGGKQYRVEAGSTLVVEKVGGEPGSSITFDRILLVGDGEDVTVGSPTVAGASVSATVLGEALGPKIVVFKFKQKVKYRRRTGHREAGSDEVGVDRSLLLLLVLPKGFPDELAHGAVFFPGQAFCLFELAGRQGHGQGFTRSHIGSCLLMLSVNLFAV